MTDFIQSLPSGSSPLRIGDDHIRSNNAALVERLAQFMYFPDNPFSSNNNALKIPLGADSSDRSSAIVSPRSGNLFIRTDTRVIGYHDGTAWRASHCMVGDTSERTAVASPDEGTLFYDTDLDALYIYEGAAWKLSTASETAYSRVVCDRDNANTQSISSGSDTELDLISTSVLETADLPVPASGSFAIEAEASIAVNTDAPASNRGTVFGIRLRNTSDSTETDAWLAHEFTNVSAGTRSYTKHMTHRFTGLTASKTYRVRAIVRTNAGGLLLGAFNPGHEAFSYVCGRLIQVS